MDDKSPLSEILCKSTWPNSAFFNFGILPEVCIHTPEEDQYSPIYKPREKCECGASEWIEGEMEIVKSMTGYEFPKKHVQRCKCCHEVRMADHIGVLKE